MFRHPHVAIRMQNYSVSDNLRSAWRFGLRILGNGGASLGSYAVLPLDHRSVLSATDPEFVYDEVMQRVTEHNAVYDHLLRQMQTPMEAAKRSIRRSATREGQPFWNNTYFQGNDASSAWALTTLARPARIVEIGSGNSTKFFRHAIDHNGLDTKLICVDPVPRAEISAVADEIHYDSVQHVSSEIFDSLRSGDMLFFDGSHLVVQGSDTQFVFLQILPRLPKGVLVHIHDVNLPFEYRQFYDSRLYGEQYMLAVLLVFAQSWKPLLPVYFLEKTGRMPVTDNPGASFWLTNDLDYVIDRIAANS
jgi:hypothetical protein